MNVQLGHQIKIMKEVKKLQIQKDREDYIALHSKKEATTAGRRNSNIKTPRNQARA